MNTALFVTALCSLAAAGFAAASQLLLHRRRTRSRRDSWYEAARAISEQSAQPIDLTRRELEILRLIAEGHSNSELAKMLSVTEQTVRYHLANIYRKFAVSNRTEASRWAQVHGLLNPRETSERPS